MSFIFRRIKNFSAIIAASLTIGIVHSAESLTLSQQPLFLKQGTDPNIMFILDDSGSMQFEVTPSEAVYVLDPGRSDNWQWRSVFYVYPNSYQEINGSFPGCPYVAGTTSNCDYWRSDSYGRLIPSFDADNRWAAYFRSSHNNKTYYDPSVRYSAWMDENREPWPDANPAKAYHNPKNISKGWRNLTADNYQTACWIDNDADKNTPTRGRRGRRGPAWPLCENGTRDGGKSFYPATYFQYDGGGDVTDIDSYERKEIRSGLIYSRGDARTDCSELASCTYDEEIQNFANWYTYYRSRALLSRAGIGQAFAAQTEGLRIGFGTLNTGERTIDQKKTNKIISGVRAFSGDARKDFFENLYGVDIPQKGTPLLSALKSAGEYYSRKDKNGPWAGKPGTNDSSTQIACRASYTILMTDGYGNDYNTKNISSFGNVDKDAGNPFQDGHSNTLADIARHYWKTDLHADLEDKVDSGEDDPAEGRQHMVTFGVSLGVTGSKDPDVAFEAIITKKDMKWPDPDDNDAAKLDDLLHAGVNSRGGFIMQEMRLCLHPSFPTCLPELRRERPPLHLLRPTQHG